MIHKIDHIYHRKVHTTRTFFTPKTHEIRGGAGSVIEIKIWDFFTKQKWTSDSHGIIEEIFQVKWLCTYVPVHHELIHHVA